MKFFRYVLFSAAFLSGLTSCKKSSENLWKIEIESPVQKVEITDISKEFYDQSVPLESFTQKYPWFQGTVSDEDFIVRRKDSTEAKIYKTAISKIDQGKLNADLAQLFSHVQYYFPEFKAPKVFLYSSSLQGALDPIFFKEKENMLFIDVTGFMGENNSYYKGLELYYQKSMNPQNIVPKVAGILAEHWVPANKDSQKFIDQIIYNGKIMTLLDAFLPQLPDHLKINYSTEQYEWAKQNETNVWTYFVENNLIFNDDPRLSSRFIAPGPFSKFYTDADRESSPQIGIYTGWQICKKFFAENPDTKLTDFLKMNNQEIFTKSHYKPKN
ncbi:gliding motility protein GldB [Chryseobacterium sp.]|uniref:gliding motility lipoprotein GldB n=1 Tax=Chryseobacterium sp. TaxID=1871047 RepID=UPI0011C8B798|nr:gliding motility protein GldB [Chryseobacterium sp.]TXF74902.1 gliding motility protein GldB [Chryseobacterium sp.]